MTEKSWHETRQLHRCWEVVEGRFYDLWARGSLWLLAGIVGLVIAALFSPFGVSASVRLGCAALVLGIGISILRILGLAQVLEKSPEAFLTMVCGRQWTIFQPPKRRYTYYLRLMEGGFILVECVALFCLLGLSVTTALASSQLVSEGSNSFWLIALVYGFFAITFAAKSMTTALGWAKWLRKRLERQLSWDGVDWMLASGYWTLTRLNLMRTVTASKLPAGRQAQKITQLLVALILMMIGAFLLMLLLLALGK